MIERDQKIRERAQQIWEEEGRPEGQHEEHWRRAAEEYDSKHPANETTENWREEAGETEDDRAPTWPTAITPD